MSHFGVSVTIQLASGQMVSGGETAFTKPNAQARTGHSGGDKAGTFPREARFARRTRKPGSMCDERLHSGPLVSVVIPTFDRPRYLRDAVRAALAQSYPNLEIIVQDNASAHDPAALLAEYGDPRIRIYRNDRTVGQTANFLVGIARARGTYVAILGDDDLWLPDFVATLVAPMEADAGIAVAFCDHLIIDADGRVDPARTEQVTRRFARHRLRPGAHARFDDIALLYRSICIVSGAVIRRDAIDWSRVPEELPLSADLYIAYLLAAAGGRCWYTPERLMQYRYHPTQITLIDRSRLAEARRGLNFWLTFLRDDRLGHHAYYKLMCAQKAALIVLDRIARRDWRGLPRDLAAFFRLGLLDPRVLFYHLFYFVRFQAMGMRRLVP